jgi:hypothetical protein
VHAHTRQQGGSNAFKDKTISKAVTGCKIDWRFLCVQLKVQQLKLCSLIVDAVAAAATHLLLLQHSQLLHRHVHV